MLTHCPRYWHVELTLSFVSISFNLLNPGERGLFPSARSYRVRYLSICLTPETEASFIILQLQWSAKYNLIHRNLYLHNILILKKFTWIIYISEKLTIFIILDFNWQEEMLNLLENRITAWLWSELFNPFDCCWSHWKLSLRLRDKWNFTNSTFTLRESFRSLSASGDHCASFKPRSGNDVTGDSGKGECWESSIRNTCLFYHI
jgi:hypothetical protein